MKPINMCTLEVRLGKCNLNLKSDGYVGVSLEIGNLLFYVRLKHIFDVPHQANPIFHY